LYIHGIERYHHMNGTGKKRIEPLPLEKRTMWKKRMVLRKENRILIWLKWF